MIENAENAKEYILCAQCMPYYTMYMLYKRVLVLTVV